MKKDLKEVRPKDINKIVVTPNVLQKSIFDTKNYWFYYTEIRKD
jgi:hypothetical protein